jgi:general stress protein 26
VTGNCFAYSTEGSVAGIVPVAYAGNVDDSYEDLTECAMSDELEHELVHSQSHCVFMWTNKQGEAFGVVQSYLPKDGTLWMTCAETRARVSALRRFPRASVCISGAGTELTSGRTVTYKGSCVLHTDQETKDWFYPEFSRYLRSDRAVADEFQKFLDSPGRIIIEFKPDYKLSFDRELMMARSPAARLKE